MIPLCGATPLLRSMDPVSMTQITPLERTDPGSMT